MRKLALLGLALVMSAGVGCRGRGIGCFRGAPCRSAPGYALPPAAQPSAGGCNGCGTVSNMYGSYDSVGDIVGSDYYGGETLSGDYYNGTIIDGGQAVESSTPPSMTPLPTP